MESLLVHDSDNFAPERRVRIVSPGAALAEKIDARLAVFERGSS